MFYRSAWNGISVYTVRPQRRRHRCRTCCQRGIAHHQTHRCRPQDTSVVLLLPSGSAAVVPLLSFTGRGHCRPAAVVREPGAPAAGGTATHARCHDHIPLSWPHPPLSFAGRTLAVIRLYLLLSSMGRAVQTQIGIGTQLTDSRSLMELFMSRQRWKHALVVQCPHFAQKEREREERVCVCVCIFI